MRVFLLLAPVGKEYKWAQQMPPLGISSIGAVLLENGHEVFAYDGSLDDSVGPSIEQIIKFKPQILGISFTTLQIKNAVAIADKVKSIERGIMVAAGGVHVTPLAYCFLSHYGSFDIVIRGEGEHTMLELVNYIEKGASISAVRGIVYRNGGNIVENQPRPLIEDMDSIPFASKLFSFFEPNAYSPFEYMSLDSQRDIVRAPMMASRGCPYSCTFCYCQAMWGASYRRRSPKNIVDEIEYLISKYKVNYIRFYDDNFCILEKDVIEMCNQIKQRGLKFKWRCEARVGPAALNEQMLCIMKEAGCHMIELGVESGSKRILESIKKQITVPMIKNAFRACHKAGLSTKAFLISGLPQEKLSDTLKTISLLFKINPDTVNLGTCQILPGTAIYHSLLKKRLINEEMWFNYGRRDIPRYYEFLSPFKKYLALVRRKLLFSYCNIRGLL